MKGSRLTGTLECWRGSGEEEMPVDVAVTLRVFPVHPSEGGGYEVDVLESTAAGQDFALTDDEIERAVERFTQQEGTP